MTRKEMLEAIISLEDDQLEILYNVGMNELVEITMRNIMKKAKDIGWELHLPKGKYESH